MTEHHPMTSESGATLLGELLEHEATGEIAVIYDGFMACLTCRHCTATSCRCPACSNDVGRGAAAAGLGVIRETGRRLARFVGFIFCPNLLHSRHGLGAVASGSTIGCVLLRLCRSG
jgi:hypothetical protein